MNGVHVARYSIPGAYGTCGSWRWTTIETQASGPVVTPWGDKEETGTKSTASLNMGSTRGQTVPCFVQKNQWWMKKSALQLVSMSFYTIDLFFGPRDCRSQAQLCPSSSARVLPLGRERQGDRVDARWELLWCASMIDIYILYHMILQVNVHVDPLHVVAFHILSACFSGVLGGGGCKNVLITSNTATLWIFHVTV